MATAIVADDGLELGRSISITPSASLSPREGDDLLGSGRRSGRANSRFSLSDGRSVRAATMEAFLELANGPNDFSRAQIEGIRHALNTVESEKILLESTEGLSQHAFFVGVVGLVLGISVFWHYPEHFWVLYTLQNMLFIPAWVATMVKVYNGYLFALDFCWLLNICFTIMMIMLGCDVVPASWRPTCYLAYFSCAVGPLGWATIILHNGLIFHSIEKMTSIFIHAYPLVACLAMRLHPERLAEAWPGRFPTAGELDAITSYEAVRMCSLVYMAWWVPYSFWLLTIGIHQPQLGRPTVFNNLYERANLGPKLVSLSGGRATSVRSHAAIYLCIHLAAVALSLLWPMACAASLKVHSASVIATLLSASWAGAGHYDFLFAKKYVQVLDKLLKDAEEKYEAS